MVEDGSHNRFLKLIDGTAMAWLYGHAIPNLYETYFDEKYMIDGRAVNGTE